MSFTIGVSFMFYCYSIVFLGIGNLYGLISITYFGLGLIVFVPHFLAIQLARNFYIKQKNKQIKKYFLNGIAFSISVFLISGLLYWHSATQLKVAKETNYENIETNYMTEKILGMHFIYHTRYCGFDGWRPPKHEPILVLGMWFNGRKDPLKGMKLEERVKLYKKYYPNNKIKFDCSCAYQYKEVYHNDKLWK